MDGSTLFMIIIGFIVLLVVAGVVANQREQEALSKCRKRRGMPISQRSVMRQQLSHGGLPIPT